MTMNQFNPGDRVWVNMHPTYCKGRVIQLLQGDLYLVDVVWPGAFSEDFLYPRLRWWEFGKRRAAGER